MAILRIRDEKGNVFEVLAIKGKDGKNGVDGYTPIKGTDYWTDADQAAIISDVLAHFVNVAEVGY